MIEYNNPHSNVKWIPDHNCQFIEQKDAWYLYQPIIKRYKIKEPNSYSESLLKCFKITNIFADETRVTSDLKPLKSYGKYQWTNWEKYYIFDDYLAFSMDDALYLKNLTNSKQLKKINKVKRYDVVKVNFNKTLIVVTNYSGPMGTMGGGERQYPTCKVSIWDMKTNQMIAKLVEGVYAAKTDFSSDSKSIALSYSNRPDSNSKRMLKIWRIK